MRDHGRESADTVCDGGAEMLLSDQRSVVTLDGAGTSVNSASGTMENPQRPRDQASRLCRKVSNGMPSRSNAAPEGSGITSLTVVPKRISSISNEPGSPLPPFALRKLTLCSSGNPSSKEAEKSAEVL